MSDYLTVAMAAERLGRSEARVRQFCAEGRFPGAARLGHAWLIPAEAVEQFRLRPAGRPKAAGPGDSRESG